MTVFERFADTHTPLIEQALQEMMAANWHAPQRLIEAMKYSLLSGGKRLRPLLVLAVADALGADTKTALPIACAIESIHTYSLIHDDLPAMDDDDYRRGRLTNHKVYGEDMAILAGDALLTHAFYMAVQACRKHGIAADAVLDIIEDLSIYAGMGGMVGGQVADISAEQGMTEFQQLEYIHTHKTSDLIVFSVKAGGRIGGADDAILSALEEYGRCIGLAFQIQDDILDIIGDEAKLGKTTNSDEKQHKVTYPFFIGLEESKGKVKELTMRGKEAILSSKVAKPDILIAIADYLVGRDH